MTDYKTSDYLIIFYDKAKNEENYSYFKNMLKNLFFSIYLENEQELIYILRSNFDYDIYIITTNNGGSELFTQIENEKYTAGIIFCGNCTYAKKWSKNFTRINKNAIFDEFASVMEYLSINIHKKCFKCNKNFEDIQNYSSKNYFFCQNKYEHVYHKDCKNECKCIKN